MMWCTNAHSFSFKARIAELEHALATLLAAACSNYKQ